MIAHPSPIYRFPALCAQVLLFTILIFGLGGCGSDKPESELASRNQKSGESFTFFELGADTIYSETTRRSLKKKLGNDAISHRNMVNLEHGYPGLIAQYFSELNDLHRRLNSEFGERIDHETVMLTYRYTRKRNVPFDYVEILFSNYNNHPLILNIHFKEDRSGTIDRLKAKYGSPEEIIWQQENGRTLYWQKNQDYLLVSKMPDQFGGFEHRIAIYFTENLRALIEAEHARRRQSSEEQAKSGQSAF